MHADLRVQVRRLRHALRGAGDGIRARARELQLRQRFDREGLFDVFCSVRRRNAGHVPDACGGALRRARLHGRHVRYELTRPGCESAESGRAWGPGHSSHRAPWIRWCWPNFPVSRLRAHRCPSTPLATSCVGQACGSPDALRRARIGYVRRQRDDAPPQGGRRAIDRRLLVAEHHLRDMESARGFPHVRSNPSRQAPESKHFPVETNLQNMDSKDTLRSSAGSIGEREALRLRLENTMQAQADRLQESRVHAEYDELTEQANRLTEEIHRIVKSRVVNEKILDLYKDDLRQEERLGEEAARSQDKVHKLYDSAGMKLPGVALGRPEYVVPFRRTLLSNRKRFLNREINHLTKWIANSRIQTRQRSDAHASLLQALTGHGALEEYTLLVSVRAVRDGGRGS